jgi:tetratricopeptide (TPR) repeat protein
MRNFFNSTSSSMLLGFILFIAIPTAKRCQKDPLTADIEQIARNSEPFEENVQLAANEHSLGNFDKAIEYYNRAIELMPTSPRAYCNRGMVKNDIGNYTGGLEDLNKAVEFAPNAAVSYANRGCSKNGLLRYQEAIADFDKALELEPNQPVYLYNRGCSKNGLSNFKEAIKDFDMALNECHRRSPWTKGTLVGMLCLSRGCSKHALKQYQEAIRDYDFAIDAGITEAQEYKALAIDKKSFLNQ